MPVIVVQKETAGRAPVKRRGAISRCASSLRYSLAKWKVQPLLKETKLRLETGGEADFSDLDRKFMELRGFRLRAAMDGLNIIQNKIFSECILEFEAKNPRLLIGYLEDDLFYSPLNMEFESGNLAETIEICRKSWKRLSNVPLSDSTRIGEVRVNHKRISFFYELFLDASTLLEEGKGAVEETISGIRAELAEKGYALPKEE